MKKLMNIALFLGTFAAVTVWAFASFAQSTCVEDIACQQDKLEAMANPRSHRVVTNIQNLKDRLEKVLLTKNTYGDAKMFNDLEILETQAQSLNEYTNASRQALKEIDKDLAPIENRIRALERTASVGEQ